MKKINLLFIFITISVLCAQAQTFKDMNIPLPAVSFSVTAFGDYDGDGDADLYLSGLDGTGTVLGGLYIYDGGTYSLSTTANIPAVYMGSADWGDIDGDNDLDIIIMGADPTYSDITEVFQNNGDGTFTSLSAGIVPAEQGEVTFADFNGDTFLDVSLSGIGVSNRITKLYSNDGTGTFTEETSVVLPGMNYGRIKWADYDNDLDLDFVLSGIDDGTGGSEEFYTEIYTNNGDGSFSVSGILLHKGWLGDTEWGDYNDDGNIDLVISGTGGDGTERFTLLYKNNGDGTFTELAVGFPGVSHSSLEWGDFDKDGDLDLFIVGEETTPGEGNSISNIYNNDGEDVFSASTEDVFSYSFYGDADSGDIDGDGKKDIVISGYYNPGYESNSAVYENTTPTLISFIEKSISISPIPAKNFIKIESIENINKVEIINISGKQMISQKFNSKDITISIENLNSGLYFVKVYKVSGDITKKIVIE